MAKEYVYVVEGKAVMNYTIIVTADNEEEAIQKIQDRDYDDIIDEEEFSVEYTDFDLFDVKEIKDE